MSNTKFQERVETYAASQPLSETEIAVRRASASSRAEYMGKIRTGLGAFAATLAIGAGGNALGNAVDHEPHNLNADIATQVANQTQENQQGDLFPVTEQVMFKQPAPTLPEGSPLNSGK